jgi:hypothetical protein
MILRGFKMNERLIRCVNQDARSDGSTFSVYVRRALALYLHGRQRAREDEIADLLAVDERDGEGEEEGGAS